MKDGPLQLLFTARVQSRLFELCGLFRTTHALMTTNLTATPSVWDQGIVGDNYHLAALSDLANSFAQIRHRMDHLLECGVISPTEFQRDLEKQRAEDQYKFPFAGEKAKGHGNYF